MVTALACGLLALATTGQEPETLPPESDATRAFGSALGKSGLPWYDAPKDAVRPLDVPARKEPTPPSPASSPSNSWSGWKLGDFIAFAGFAVTLAALIGLLVWLWRLYEPNAKTEGPPGRKARGAPSRVEELPAGLRREVESSDPWSEAIRRRDRGDLAGAVVCLFAHQLLTLSHLGLVRLAPGRTGRQLLRAVADAEFRGLVHPTLRLFESVYYGHRQPSADEFAAVWASAEAFERRVAAGVVG